MRHADADADADSDADADAHHSHTHTQVAKDKPTQPPFPPDEHTHIDTYMEHWSSTPGRWIQNRGSKMQPLARQLLPDPGWPCANFIIFEIGGFSK